MTKIALLIIDMQNAYFTSDTLHSRQADLIDRINELIHQVKKSGGVVINVRTEHAEDRSTWTLNMLRDGQGFLFKGTNEAQTVSGLDVSNAIEVIKTRDSAFYNTPLKDTLQEFAIDTVIMCGVSTHTCITQSAADAYAADIHVILAEKAIADDTPDFHDVSLRQLAKDYRQEILPNTVIIKKLRV